MSYNADDETKLERFERKLLYTHVILALWNKLPREKTTITLSLKSGDFQEVEFIHVVNNKAATYHYGHNLYISSSFDKQSISYELERAFRDWVFRTSGYNCGVVGESNYLNDRQSWQSWDETYVTDAIYCTMMSLFPEEVLAIRKAIDIDTQIAKEKTRLEKETKSRLNRRATRFNIGEQQEIVAELALGYINQFLTEKNLPFRLDVDSLRLRRGEGRVDVSLEVIGDEYLQKLLNYEINTENADYTGSAIIEGAEKLGIDSKEANRILTASTNEIARRFATTFGDNIAPGLLDASQLVRAAAELKKKKAKKQSELKNK